MYYSIVSKARREKARISLKRNIAVPARNHKNWVNISSYRKIIVQTVHIAKRVRKEQKKILKKLRGSSAGSCELTLSLVMAASRPRLFLFGFFLCLFECFKVLFVSGSEFLEASFHAASVVAPQSQQLEVGGGEGQ